jgi:glycosyltransferase involved in cell wall biosynthesis
VVLGALKKVIHKADNMKLLIVGYGSNVKAVLNLSKEFGLEDRIFYLGSKEDKIELAEILSACDVGVIPYDSNPLWKTTIPAKALEYFACGLPVLVTYYKDSVIGNLISENQIGLRSDPEDIDGLSVNIEKIYNDSAFVVESAKRASSLVERCFDRNKTAEVLLKSILLSANYGNGRQ